MNVLIIGSGGREHALFWKLKQSPLLKSIYVAPGNGGIKESVEIDISYHPSIINFCGVFNINLVIIGSEVPLVAGLVDDLAAYNILAFGPSKLAAQLEGSKDFTKQLCVENNIPTAKFKTCSELWEAQAYIKTHALPIVLKADGLAAGKGVTIATTRQEAEATLASLFEVEGAKVVIEEFLQGEEASFFVLCDGETALPLTSAQDHKRVGEGDTGPNTGGMGAYSPAPIMDERVTQKTMDEIIYPTLKAMQARGTPFKGVLFAGLMIHEGQPKLIEYNARFGDPETQVLMMRLESDLLPLLHASATGSLQGQSVKWRDEKALTVVMAAKGYPAEYEKGSLIQGLEEAENTGAIVFHAGTKRSNEGIIANGGRVLNICALGASVKEAQEKAYAGVDKIIWPEGFCRRDIGFKAV
jgi:phosphoribosylamine---glycine ligase